MLKIFHKEKKEQPQVSLEIYDAALMGDPYAKYILGGALATGIGAPKDVAGALLLLRQAAEGGCLKASYMIYKILLGKSYGINDNVNGIEWLKVAADIGEPEAMRDLGKMLIEGNAYLPADPITARALLKEAAEKGDQKAKEIYKARFA